MQQSQAWGKKLGSALGMIAILSFFLWLPYLSSSGLYEAVSEIGRIQAYLAVLREQPPLSAVTFANSLPDRTVVVEGTVSNYTPTIFRDSLVIFIHNVYIDNARSSGWRERERVLRPLILDIDGPDARVQVENPSADTPIATYDVYNLTRHIDEPASRRYGLVHGEPVLVVGTVVQGPEQPYLDADMVCAGNRESCTAVLQRERWNKLGGAVILGVITLALIAVALVVAWAALDRIVEMRINAESSGQ